MTKAGLDPTKRFSNRVEDYVKYRPEYPEAILDLLHREARFTTASVIADIGSGTGKLSLLLLSHGNRVYGVEPNDQMRSAGEKVLADYPEFVSVDGTAEATTLTTGSVDLITAGQAFHWFDKDRAGWEFRRILKAEGHAMLLWNDWHQGSSDFKLAYEGLLETYGLDFRKSRHSNVSASESIRQFYAPNSVVEHHFENHQLLDFTALRGRLLSSSYSPPPGHPNYEPMIAELNGIFKRHAVDNQVRFDYDTIVYLGQLKLPPSSTP